MLIRNPPLEWRFNMLLVELAEKIDESEFEIIKLLHSDQKYIDEDLLNQCDTCIKLFTVLKEKRYITRDNILYLNRILYTLGRKDLINRTVEYCNEEGNVIHHYSVEGKPENGKRYVILHVVTDVRNFNNETLGRLRDCLADTVLAPVEVIVTSAVELVYNVLITFSMPDICVEVLKELLQRKVNLWELSSLQVEIINVDDVHYDVPEQSDENENELLTKTDVILTVLRLTVFGIHLKCPKLWIKRKKELIYEVTTMMQKTHSTSDVSDVGLGSFLSLRKEASDKGQDMGYLQKIIKAVTEISATYHRCVDELKSEGQIKQWKIIERMHLRKTALKNTTYDQQTLDFYLTLNLGFAKTLYDISKTEVKAEEREELMKKVTWSKDDGEKACIEPVLHLGSECKQAEQTQTIVDTGQFLTASGKEIGKDLLKMYNKSAKHQKQKNQDEKRKNRNLQLIDILTSKSKSPEDIVLSYAETFDFNYVMLPTYFVKLMTQKSKGLILFLNEDECTKLLNTCTWYDQDVIKECIKKDRRLLFPGLLCKEMERTGKVILPEEVIIRLQEFIKRKDLLVLFHQLKTDEKELQTQIDHLHERQKKEQQLLQMLSTGQVSAEEVLRLKLKQYTLKLDNDIETPPQFEKVAKRFGDLSGKVDRKQQAELIELYKWDKNDIIKACITADKRLLFEGLWCKDIEITQMMTPLDSFWSYQCPNIIRTDIFDNFNEILMDIYEKRLQHLIDETDEYYFTTMLKFSPLSMLQKLLGILLDEAGASSIP